MRIMDSPKLGWRRIIIWQFLFVRLLGMLNWIGTILAMGHRKVSYLLLHDRLPIVMTIFIIFLEFTIRQGNVSLRSKSRIRFHRSLSVWKRLVCRLGQRVGITCRWEILRRMRWPTFLCRTMSWLRSKGKAYLFANRESRMVARWGPPIPGMGPILKLPSL